MPTRSGGSVQRARRDLERNRRRINATVRGTPSGRWTSRSRTIVAIFRQPCAGCRADIVPGTRIKRRAKGWVHADCNAARGVAGDR